MALTALFGRLGARLTGFLLNIGELGSPFAVFVFYGWFGFVYDEGWFFHVFFADLVLCAAVSVV